MASSAARRSSVSKVDNAAKIAAPAKTVGLPTAASGTGAPRGGFRASLTNRRYPALGLVLLLVALIVFPSIVQQSWVDAINQTMIAALGAIALNILLGVAGQFSLGSAAIMAVGSFTAAIASTEGLHLPFVLGLLAGTITGGVTALILGVIALRIRGFYLVLATIALNYIVIFFAQNYQEKTVGVTGFIMPPVDLFGIPIVSTNSWYILLIIILAVVTWGSWNLLRSRTGRAFKAIKNRDVAAALLGVNVTKTKLLVFIITSMLIGFQGALYAYYVSVVTYDTFTIDLSVQFVAMIIIGGLASIAGSILGAIFVTMLPYIVQAVVPLLPSWFPFDSEITGNLFAVQSILYGIAIIIFMWKVPGGLAGAFRRLGRWLARRIDARATRRGGRSEAGA
jgi:branched-chain amino acid transport system permease protein